jgi:ankyrin repeat protein
LTVKVYENLFPNESDVAVFRNMNTEEIIWVGETLPNQEELMSHLRQNDSVKWNGVFLWFAANCFKLKNKSTNKPFLKALMFAIAENVAVTFTDRKGLSPLMLAAAFDDKDSILALIKRDANVNQQDNYGWTSLHIAAAYGNIDACADLLDKDADIDLVDNFGWTPLITAAFDGNKNMYKFLIKKGADETLTTDSGATAAQLTRF